MRLGQLPERIEFPRRGGGASIDRATADRRSTRIVHAGVRCSHQKTRCVCADPNDPPPPLPATEDIIALSPLQKLNSRTPHATMTLVTLGSPAVLDYRIRDFPSLPYDRFSFSLMWEDAGTRITDCQRSITVRFSV